MAKRQDRPAFDLASGSLNVTLPDGSTVPIPTRGGGPTSAEICCFCGEALEHADRERVRVAARWLDGDQERQQSWGAHHRCLRDRLHERVGGEGPFFDDD